MAIRTVMQLAAGDTTGDDARGSSIGTKYALEPIKWLKEINDAAQKDLLFTQSITQSMAGPNVKDVVIPFRTDYLKTVRPGLAGSSGDWSVSETNDGGAITFTKIDNMDGVTVTPIDRSAGVALPYHVLRTNALDMLQQAKNELIYHAGDEVDQQVAYKLQTATDATTSARGAQTVYAGDATADSEITSDDTMEPDLITTGKTRLQSRKVRWWNSGTLTVSTAEKPPWRSKPGDPFLLFISSEQEGALLKSSQFVNAAEYGGQEPLLNGEIGKYVGVKTIVTENTPKVATGGTAFDGGSVPITDIARCMLIKPKAAAALVWGMKPKLHVFDYQRELEKDLVMEQAYEIETIHDDAIVFIDVADN